MINLRQHVRNLLDAPRKLSLIVIPFKKLEKLNITAQAVDVSEGGMGINTDRALDPGFVVLRNGVGTFNNGVLLWSKSLNDRTYRAGIQYVPLIEKYTPSGSKHGPTDAPIPALSDPETERMNRFATAVFMHTTRGIMVADADGRVQSVNDAFVKITGYGAAETIGKDLPIFKTDVQNDAFHAHMQYLLRQKGVWSGIYWNRRKNGEVYPQETTINAIKNDAGKIVQYCSIFSDVTEHYQAEERLRLLSTTDGLTNLANRRSFDESMKMEWRRARRFGYSLAVIMVDIDNFKKYNDTYGHLEGDKCLKMVGGALKHAVHRAGDLAARYGGEEFVLLMPMTVEREALKIADDLRQHIEALKIPHQCNAPYNVVTISMGVAALVPLADMFQNDLIDMADKALYRAKESGKNCVTCLEDEKSVTGKPDSM
jgi:diguanylate cyclase (GGDEF)-like protein/PAS domain S-box-containing protein